MTIAVPEEQIAALCGRRLFLIAEQEVAEALRLRTELDANAPFADLAQTAHPASAGIPFAADGGPGAVARVDMLSFFQRVERIGVDCWRVALSHERAAALIGLESQPGEILEERDFVLGPAPDAIMIFEPQDDSTAAGWRRGKATDRQ